MVAQSRRGAEMRFGDGGTRKGGKRRGSREMERRLENVRADRAVAQNAAHVMAGTGGASHLLWGLRREAEGAVRGEATRRGLVI